MVKLRDSPTILVEARVCQQYEFYNNKNMSRSVKFATLLITYEVLLKDKVVLSKIKWNYLMVDEALELKNSEASLYTTLLLLEHTLDQPVNVE
ncbi:protein CHROMATIN REMODELING 5-like [Olea europaea var. sylvestris]|uniref:protein CHROMATIN REMODELING 5-like n=1 Tax=Olea europaea var. sylvestris TaxID=158386 RepID=UPI000C1D1196|nr:protein CHROMATIN REMODELING 5-like [Olea europaea var. sylvestris]